MSRWHIYIDESGRRDRGGDHIHLAGFICHNDGQGTLAAFERACRDDLGFFPWPLHTAHLNMPIALILALRVASDAGDIGPKLASITDSLQARMPTIYSRAIAALQARQNPKFDDLRALAGALTPDRARWASSTHAQLLSHLDGLLAEVGAHSAHFALVSSEPHHGALGRGVDAQPYVDLLTALAKRALQHISADPHDGDQITFHVLNTKVGAQHINYGRLKSWLKAAGPRSRFEVELETYEGDDLPVAYFLADYLANRARRSLRGVDALQDREARLKAATHLNPRGQGSLLTAAEPINDEADPWASAQAKEWA